MTLEELERNLRDRQDVTEDDVRDLLVSANPYARLHARGALARTGIRQALMHCAGLAAEQGYSDQGTLDAIQRLAAISDIDEPYIETLKQVGIQAAHKGACNAALQYLQEAVSRAFASGQRNDARSRRAMRYAHDPEIDAAIETLAAFFAVPSLRPVPAEPLRLSVLCSGLQDEDGPTVMTVKRTEYFREQGFNVSIVSTETGHSANTRMSQHVRDLGIPFLAVPRATYEERIRWLIAHYAQFPADAIVYMISAQDLLGKLAACIGLAPVQSFDVRALEPQAGKFDLINHGLSPEQEVKTRWPGIARYTGPTVAMADEIDAASPMERSELKGVPPDAIVLATFGRLEKCNTPTYLEAMAAVLSRAPKAYLLLAGPDSLSVLPGMMQHFQSFGVAERVVYLGQRQADGPRLVKTIDVYCDTYPWPGGQSLLDAMQASRPVVAMKRADDPDLDPTGTGATTSVADIFLSGLVPLARAGDVNGYAEIALRYIADAGLREHDGARLRHKAVTDCNMRAGTALYAKLIREIVAEKSAAATVAAR